MANSYTSKHESSGGRLQENFMRSLLIDIVIAALVAAAILFFVRPTVVKQSSMENTFIENDYLIMYKRAYVKAEPQRGDIVIFQSHLADESTGKEKLLIKRIVGLPGDKITIKDEQLYINDEKYSEDYIKDGYTTAEDNPASGESIVVPEGEYYALGDNRAVSIDSRSSQVGFVPKEDIKGKVVLRLYPFNKIRRF